MNLKEKISGKPRRFVEFCAASARNISGACLLGLMLLISINVIGRYLFRFSLNGTYELAGFLGASVIALALADYQLSGNIVIVDIFSRHFDPKARAVLDRINNLLSAVFYLVLGFSLAGWGLLLSESREVSETLKIVYYPVVFLVAFGFLLFSAALVVSGSRVKAGISPEQGGGQ